MRFRPVLKCAILSLACLLFLSHVCVFSGSGVTTEGVVSKVVGDIVFLGDSSQSAFHISAGSTIEGVSAASELPGKKVSITYQADGNLNRIITLKVIG
jgi:hypothetical protein